MGESGPQADNRLGSTAMSPPAPERGSYNQVIERPPPKRHDELPPVKRHNSEVAWVEFEPNAYWDHNYRSLRADDRAILKKVGRFFSDHFQGVTATSRAGVDVGSGSNLYPALAMLPWCTSIELTDWSESNVAWLKRHADGGAASGAWSWKPFWDVLARFPGYDRLDDPRSLLSRIHTVEQLSVFDLAERCYDVGTMFFVAESMTSYPEEFEDATLRFLGSLRPGAPFAAAFMDSSVGYVVGDKFFPAVSEVARARVEAVLKSCRLEWSDVTKIPVPANDPLRDGYEGMLIAVGVTRGT